MQGRRGRKHEYRPGRAPRIARAAHHKEPPARCCGFASHAAAGDGATLCRRKSFTTWRISGGVVRRCKGLLLAQHAHGLNDVGERQDQFAELEESCCGFEGSGEETSQKTQGFGGLIIVWLRARCRHTGRGFESGAFTVHRFGAGGRARMHIKSAVRRRGPVRFKRAGLQRVVHFIWSRHRFRRSARRRDYFCRSTFINEVRGLRCC